MKNENENVPEIEQGLHERLCAYVFGELQGAEREAFEGELLRSPVLQAEHVRLTATIGLVKRAVPDEGLPTEVRREILASARRSRFRVLRGRGLLTLAAAALVLASAALALRYYSGEKSPFTYELFGSGQVAKLEDSSRLAERKITVPAGKPRRGSEPAAAVVAREARSEDQAEQALPTEEQVNFESSSTVASSYPSNPNVTLNGTQLTPPVAPEAYGLQPPLPIGTDSFAGSEGPFYLTKDATLRDLGEPAAGPAGPSTPGPGAEGWFLGRGEKRGAVASTPVAGTPRRLDELSLGQGAFRGPGDSPARGGQAAAQLDSLAMPVGRQAGLVVTDGKAPASAAKKNPVVVEELRGLGYLGDGERKELQDLGYAAGEAPVELRDDLDGLGYGSDDKRSGEDDRAKSRRVALTPVEIDGIAARLVGACRLQPGETPRDMFFRCFGDSPFVSTQEERTSTFSVDVDTASYTLARSYLNEGRLPPREAVRTEEFVNYFRADQPAPANGEPFALGLELAPSLFAKDARTELLRVTVRAKDVESFQRQPMALTFVIDNSGSMNEGGRLELVKRSLALLLGELNAGDSVALVKFSNSASVVAPMVSAARRGELEDQIRALAIEGGTNVEAGLRVGYEVAVQNLARNAVNRVILCSDGVGNIGETNAQGLLALVQEARAKGVYLNTIGVGMGNHNDAFLEELADRGDGVCHYVDSDAEAKKVFVEGLAKALQPIARDVKIQVEFDPLQVESWRLLGYENRALRTQDFDDDRIDAGEVNAGHQVTALYELVRNPRDGGALASVRVRYKLPFAIDRGDEGTRASAEAEKALELERSLHASSVLPGFAAASGGFKRSALVAQFAEVLRQSVHARGESFARLLEEARALERALADPDVTEFVTLLEKANPLLDARAKQETPRLQELLDELGRLHYEQALRERHRDLAQQAGEGEKASPEEKQARKREEARADFAASEAIQRLEAEVRAELQRVNGAAPAEVNDLGYSDGDEGGKK